MMVMELLGKHLCKLIYQFLTYFAVLHRRSFSLYRIYCNCKSNCIALPDFRQFVNRGKFTTCKHEFKHAMLVQL